jgi:hypothetical protein
MADGVYRTGRAVEVGTEAKRETLDGGNTTAINGALSGMPISVFLLYFMLFIHLIMMGAWLIYKNF